MQRVRTFIESESSGGIALALAALAALIVANSPLAGAYQAALLWHAPLPLADSWPLLSQPLAFWVNELWMAVFFLLVGLEIKREARVGELASLKQAALPLAAALGGMLVPAAIYVAINHGDAIGLRGWAIPMATDIAFALAVVALLGPRVPASLKVFLTAVAIIDDLGAIVVIALFYTDRLSLPMLLGAGAGTAVLVALNRARVSALAPYALVGGVVWAFVLGSGVHATLAGVITALAVPLRTDKGDGQREEGQGEGNGNGPGPLERAERALQPWVAYLILPAFAFVNAGVSLAGLGTAALLGGVPLGIAAGLVLGKPAGVLGASWLFLRASGGRLTHGARWSQWVGVAALCGIGFTMSLLIGGMAFEGAGTGLATQLKLAVIGASLLSAAIGAAVLLAGARPTRPRREDASGAGPTPRR